MGLTDEDLVYRFLADPHHRCLRWEAARGA